MKKQKLVDKIMSAGLKNTKYRVYMIDLLSKSEKLMSAQDIYLELMKKKVNINLSTVYRTLDKLVETKIINRVQMEHEKQALFEYNRNIHHHFLTCLGCNKIIPIYECPLKDYEEQLQEKTGFILTGHSIEFYGYCKDCQEKLKIKEN